MSENTTTTAAEAEAGAGAGSGFDWAAITGQQQEAAAGAAARNLPPTPPNTGILVGRLPIKGDTGRAVLELPEPTKDVHCAVVMPNTGVLSDCYRPAKNRCVPNALRAYPLNDRQIEVVLDGGEGVVKGAGWVKDGSYPGAPLKTRSVETGVPYVEVLVVVGVDCGCDSDNWAAEDEWG